MITKTITCQRCGASRTVECQNWKQVTLCLGCYYLKRRVYNSKYQAAYRIRKKHAKNKNIL